MDELCLESESGSPHGYDDCMAQCGLCQSSSIEFYFRDFRGNAIWQCRNCGVQFMNPQYSEEYLAAYYSRYYVKPDKIKRANALRYEQHIYFDLIERFAERGKLLDVGCGQGYALEVAQERGWRVTGFDVDCDMTAQVAQEKNLELLCGDFLELNWQDATFDAITMHQVLEHLKNPLAYFERIRQILAKNGVLFVSVPNIRSFSAALKRGLERAGVRKRRVGAYYDSDHHLWYYSPKVLKELLSRQGFRPVYATGCHKMRPNQPEWFRRLRRGSWERLKLNSAFLIIGIKE